MTKSLLTAVLFTLTASLPAWAQEGAVPTQTIIQEVTKGDAPLTAAALSVKINNRETPITSVSPVAPAGVQIALLLDDGLRQSFSRNMEDMRRFINGLPSGAEIFIGYMSNGRVIAAQPFTTDHEAAAEHLRITLGQPGISASPYFCLSDFVKRWPGAEVEGPRSPEALQPISGGGRAAHKARFVLMMSNGVDPYNGSVSPLNQDSPYVATAIRDAQRAGVPVSSIYYGDAGIRGGAASFSGQGYLSQVAEGTGGTAYYEGTGNPVSLTPFFTQFQNAIAESYVTTFLAGGKDLVQVKISTNLPKVKLKHASEIRPGTQLVD